MAKGRLITTALIIVAASLAGCTTVAEKNAARCEQEMRTAAEPALVSVSENQQSPGGRSVLVSGMVEDRRSHTLVPAKAECRFNGKSLAAFHWIAPSTLADSGSPRANAGDLAQ